MFQTQKKKEQGTLDVAISGKVKNNSIDQDFMHLNSIKIISRSEQFYFKILLPNELKWFSGNFRPSLPTVTSLINRHVILFFSRKKLHPTRCFLCNRLKIPPYLPVLQIGWIFHPTRLFKPTLWAYSFTKEVRVHSY